MTKRTYSVHIDDDVYQMLRDEKERRTDKTSLRQLLHGYIREGIQRSKELNNFDNALKIHIDNSSDGRGFKEYLNQSYIIELIRLLDVTRPSYNDVAQLFVAKLFWKIDGKELFNTLLTYAKYGLSDLRGGE